MACPDFCEVLRQPPWRPRVGHQGTCGTAHELCEDSCIGTKCVRHPKGRAGQHSPAASLGGRCARGGKPDSSLPYSRRFERPCAVAAPGAARSLPLGSGPGLQDKAPAQQPSEHAAMRAEGGPVRADRAPAPAAAGQRQACQARRPPAQPCRRPGAAGALRRAC